MIDAAPKEYVERRTIEEKTTRKSTALDHKRFWIWAFATYGSCWVIGSVVIVNLRYRP